MSEVLGKSGLNKVGGGSTLDRDPWRNLSRATHDEVPDRATHLSRDENSDSSHSCETLCLAREPCPGVHALLAWPLSAHGSVTWQGRGPACAEQSKQAPERTRPCGVCRGCESTAPSRRCALCDILSICGCCGIAWETQSEDSSLRKPHGAESWCDSRSRVSCAKVDRRKCSGRRTPCWRLGRG